MLPTFISKAKKDKSSPKILRTHKFIIHRVENNEKKKLRDEYIKSSYLTKTHCAKINLHIKRTNLQSTVDSPGLGIEGTIEIDRIQEPIYNAH